MKKRFIPFSWIPKNWKLEGKHRKREWAYYYLTDYELELELLDIKHDNKALSSYKIEKLQLDEKYGKLKSEDLNKEIATLEEKPYFKVVKGEYKETGPGQGTMMFELDWNEYFVAELKSNGWIGETEDFIVNAWFEDSCKQMINEENIEQFDSPVTSFNRTRKRPISKDTSEYS